MSDIGQGSQPIVLVAAPRKVRRRWPWFVLAGVLLLLGGGVWLEFPPHLVVPPIAVPSPNAYDNYADAAGMVQVSPGEGTFLLQWCLRDAENQAERRLFKANTISQPPNPVLTLTAANPADLWATRDAWLAAHPPIGVSPEHLAALCRAHAAALALVRQGFAYRGRPTSRTLAHTETMGRLWSLNLLLAAQGYLARRQGNWSEAVMQDMDALRLAFDLQRGQGVRNGLWYAQMQENIRPEIWAALPHLTALEARVAAVRLEPLYRWRMTYSQALDDDWQVLGEQLQTIFARLNWRAALRDYADRQCGLGSDPDTASPASLPATPADHLRTLLMGKSAIVTHLWAGYRRARNEAKGPWTPGYLPVDAGDRYAQELLLPISPVMRARFEQIGVQDGMLMTALALQAFHTEHGKYPTALEVLTPYYLHHLPDDPFAPGGLLRYRLTPTGYLLYSVGPDGQDDGGTPSADGRGGGLPLSLYSKGDIVAGINLF